MLRFDSLILTEKSTQKLFDGIAYLSSQPFVDRFVTSIIWCRFLAKEKKLYGWVSVHIQTLILKTGFLFFILNVDSFFVCSSIKILIAELFLSIIDSKRSQCLKVDAELVGILDNRYYCKIIYFQHK